MTVVVVRMRCKRGNAGGLDRSSSRPADVRGCAEKRASRAGQFIQYVRVAWFVVSPSSPHCPSIDPQQCQMTDRNTSAALPPAQRNQRSVFPIDDPQRGQVGGWIQLGFNGVNPHLARTVPVGSDPHTRDDVTLVIRPSGGSQYK